ncbi:type II toxin-antitoxin system HipA family toxin YjjJ [Chrysiogenes arsenatis]|uniref:type II toxin-antitoxin system HipA family toxin YjjJ n=1 Tax=Chrysiogenes arsenatis TaxID=309797 RepID=UPI000400EC29|nr:type II toxin-antitoxin system HipA family toxin YjjJ [Chrysiogenes arsenatis]
MANKYQQARERLEHVLSREAGSKATTLAKKLNISLATLHRLLKEPWPALLVSGKARRTRYALRRAVRGSVEDIPVYQINEAGQASLFAPLALVHPAGSWMSLEGTDWPQGDENHGGWWDGLPYPLYQLQPQGFMGRNFARAIHQPLEVPDNPLQWSDEHLIYVLTHKGCDLSGNLIVGDTACERWQLDKLNPPSPLSEVHLETRYIELAEQALSSGRAGSSAAGEFPKFTAIRELPGSATPHVIVKFSGADNSPAVTRWRDLLICEQLASEQINEWHDLRAAKSRILHAHNRIFLEVERFDRHGQFGRSPLISLEIINAALLGKAPVNWPSLADAMHSRGWLQKNDRDRVHLLWWFGTLIANTDMHFGNLSFRPYQGTLQLAPSYDMLPMLYAPLAGGELPLREFTPTPPLPRQRALWLTACEAAIAFWSTASQDQRITDGFRHIARENTNTLITLRARM